MTDEHHDADDTEHPDSGPASPSSEGPLPPVEGFQFAGLCCGIKPDDVPDLGLIAAEEPVATAALFTQNRLRAAPVDVANARVERGRAQAILVNSGSANACTGKEGVRAVDLTTDAVARELDIDTALVLPASTGVIGEPLPVERMEQAAPQLVQALRPDGMDDFARAILTTDQGPKVGSLQVNVGGQQKASIVGIAKGAGMIHPNMATTLAFVVTDAPMHSSFLKRALHTAVERTFNRISVDGDTSTNDAIFAMSSSRVEAPPLSGSDPDARRFIDSLTQVLDALARMIVADGEGAEHVVTFEVTDAPSESAAQMVAERVATSSLVKTALHGGDANWGRILAAAGMAGVAFDPNKLEVRFGDVVVVRKGCGQGPIVEAKAREVMRQPQYTIRISLGGGNAKSHYVTCDLGHEYVRINAHMRS